MTGTTAPFSDVELEQIREQLPAVLETTYLNAGTLGPMPRVAIDAMQAQFDLDADTRQPIDLWERLTQLQDDARAVVGSLVGVDASNVALMHSTHEAINTCVWGLGLQAGDNVVTLDEEHPGLLIPLRHATQRAGADIRMAHWHGQDAHFVDDVLTHVDKRTRAVFVSHVSWVTGRIAPLALLREALPAECRLVVDGAQSAGAMMVDAADGWDAYTISGQKWPCGPNGSGGLALAEPCAWETTFGGMMQVEEYDECLTSAIRADARRFEFSQEAMLPLVGIAASIDWLHREVMISRAQQHSSACNSRARQTLGQALEPDEMHGQHHLLCINVAAGTAPDIVRSLAERRISIRPLGADRVRLSFGAWNTLDEVDECADLIASYVRPTSS